jgi:hypothetical protein
LEGLVDAFSTIRRQTTRMRVNAIKTGWSGFMCPLVIEPTKGEPMITDNLGTDNAA